MLAKNLTWRILFAVLLAATLFSTADAFNLNKSIRIEAGSTSDGQSTVNGSITVGSGAVVNGAVETVNGTITIDDNARVENAETVNGSIRLHDGATANNLNSVNGSIRVASNTTVGGEVSVVNGKITVDSGSVVSGDTGTVNGEIRIDGADLGGNLTTTNGDIEITNDAILRGDLVVEKPSGWGWNKSKQRKPRVIVGPGVEIVGEIRLEREVELFISDSATVGGVSGEMTLDDAVRFSGRQP